MMSYAFIFVFFCHIIDNVILLCVKLWEQPKTCWVLRTPLANSDSLHILLYITEMLILIGVNYVIIGTEDTKQIMENLAIIVKGVVRLLVHHW